MSTTTKCINVVLVVFATMQCALAFTTPSSVKNAAFTRLNMVPQAPPPAYHVQTPSSVTAFTTSSPILNDGISQWSAADSSSVTLSLQERKPPTPEEIAAKKRNFNLLFWGGGFVAPFLATFFYFGFKFWEK